MLYLVTIEQGPKNPCFLFAFSRKNAYIQFLLCKFNSLRAHTHKVNFSTKKGSAHDRRPSLSGFMPDILIQPLDE